MAPLTDCMTRLIACFQHERRHTALEEMCRGGKTNRSSPDNRNSLDVCHLPFTIFLEAWDLSAKKSSCRFRILTICFDLVGATFGHQEVHQSTHHYVIRMTDQSR